MKYVLLLIFVVFAPFCWAEVAIESAHSKLQFLPILNSTLNSESGFLSSNPPLSLYSEISPEAFSFQNKPTNNRSDSTAATNTYISAADIKRYSKGSRVFLRSHVAVIYDERDKEYIFTRNANKVMSIASLTKLMTAMVVLDAKLPMDTVIKITKADKDRIRYSKSRLRFGSRFTRGDLLLIALLSSENRAAAALARPG